MLLKRVAILMLLILTVSTVYAFDTSPVRFWKVGKDSGWVSISRDGEYVASLAYDGFETLCLCKNDSMDPLWTFNNGNSLFGRPFISANGSIVGIEGPEGILIFETDRGPIPISEYPHATALSENGEYVSTFNDSNVLSLFKMGTDIPMWTKQLNQPLNQSWISGNGSYMVAMANFTTIYVFRCEDGTYWTYYLGYNNSRKVALSYDGNYFVVTIRKNDGTPALLFFSTSNPSPLWEKDFEESFAFFWTSPLISDDGSICAVIAGNYSSVSSGSPDVARLYVFETEKPFEPQTADINNEVDDSAMSSDGRAIFLPTFGGLYSFEYDNGSLTLKWRYEDNTVPENEFNSASASADGRYVAAARWNSGGLYLFDNTYESPSPEPWSQWWFWAIVSAAALIILVSVSLIRRRKRRSLLPSSSPGTGVEK